MMCIDVEHLLGGLSGIYKEIKKILKNPGETHFIIFIIFFKIDFIVLFILNVYFILFYYALHSNVIFPVCFFFF